MEDFQDPFNPATQYEQGYLYYKFLTQQVEYRIKCKELEKLNKSQTFYSHQSKNICVGIAMLY